MEETLDTAEKRRHQYGVILSLQEFRQAYNDQTGLCRGCKAHHVGTPHGAKALTCKACGKARVFGANWFAWNGWIEELPATSWRGRNIKRLLTEEPYVGK